MSKKSKSWIDLLKYIINFFRFKKKEDQLEKQKELKKINEKNQNKYDKIDEAKEKKKNKDVKKRLDNLF